MKKILLFTMMFFMVMLFTFGQEFGSIKGTVLDEDGSPLPGVNVTLNGSKIATMTDVTSEYGNFRFLRLPVADDYTLRLEVPGFKTVIREQLVVIFGRDLNLNIDMEVSQIEEAVTVVGQAPIIDTKKAQVGQNVSQDMIMKLPTARNPWVLMDVIPGMLVDKSDVGGNEAGQQSNYYGHGSAGDDNTWNIDGANVTDNSALGAAPSYFNVAGYEEIQVNYGNNDIQSQTGGVQINFVSKRGGNSYSGTFYLDAQRGSWQSDNVPQDLKDIGYSAAGINRLYLYGANFGGPIWKDRVWFYASWGIQDIDALTLAGTSDETWLTSGYGRLDFQLTDSTRANFFVEYDNKQKWGRAWVGYTQQSADSLWDQTGPGYLWKGEIDQSIGNLFLSGKVIFTNGGFALMPQKEHTSDGTGDYHIWRYYPSYYMEGNTVDYGTDRDQINVNLNGIFFTENILGADHEFKFGVDYVSSMTTSYSLYESDIQLAYYGPDSSLPLGEYWEAWLTRDYLSSYNFERFSAYLQDTLTFGRLALNLGVRYDREASMIKDLSIPANMWIPEYLPALSVDELDPGVAWNVISPRFSLSYDLFGTGKDILKVAIARYGSQSGNEIADEINPLGYSEIDVFWQDFNGDGRVTKDELFGYDWDTNELKNYLDPNYWLWTTSTVNPNDPTAVVPLNKYDPDYNSPLLDELSVSYEKELMPNFSGRLEFFYKKRHHQKWIRSMKADGTLETEDNYYVAGVDETTGTEYYGRNEFFPYRYFTNHDKAFDRYLGGQIVFNKRLSNGWMLNSSFTLSDWRRYYEGEFLGVIDDIMASEMTAGINNEDYFDGGVVAPESSGSGITELYSNARWQFKLSGLVQLPMDINLSGVFNARDGYVRPTYHQVSVPGIGSEKIYGSPNGGQGKYGDERLPNYYVLNLRLEKVFALSDTSSVALGADAFNLLNSSHSLKQENSIIADNYGQALRILNPRVFRFGVRFSF